VTFDEFWNDEWAYPAEHLAAEPNDDDHARIRALLEATPDEEARLTSFPLAAIDWTPFLADIADRLSFGQWLAVSDEPLSSANTPDQVFVSIGRMVMQAQREIAVVSAYFVPDDAMIDAFARYTAAGVRVRILTNSLGSNNHTIVNSQYKRYRTRLLDAGVELYEMRHDPLARSEIDTPPIEADTHVLHTKAVLIDREQMYVGALNITPRSIRLNSENGLLVRDATLVGALAASIDRDLEPDNAWRVTRDEGDELRWQSTAGVVRRQPARNTWQRVADWLFGLFPLENQI
jgi:putative cardiolipin synthase